MTSTGKYKVNTTNLYNRHQDDYTSANNYSIPRRPYRTNNQSNRLKPSYEDATDGEDEKKLLNLSERIKRLSNSRVLKDNSVLTHNNNEPFTYLRAPQKKGGLSGVTSGVNIGVYPGGTYKPTVSSHNTNGIGIKSREVIYAQVVVDPEDRKNKQRSKRTVHRSYNNNNYPPINQPASSTRSINRNPLLNQRNPPSSTSESKNMKGKNVTTVLLNSSSDDIPSSLNMEERIGGFYNDSRYRSSSSPLLTNNDDYYPKSPGIVKQHLQNGHNSANRSRYENHYQKHSTDYYRQSDEDDYNDYKFRGKHKEKRNHSPLFPSSYGGGGRDTDNSDDFYQPVNYGTKSASTNFIDGYGYNKPRANYRIDEEDEFDTRNNNKRNRFEDKRSKTLERDSSFRMSHNRTEDFINRSKTLDNRISSLRERSMMLKEQNLRERGGGEFNPYSDLTTSNELDSDFINKRNNAQNATKYSSTNATSKVKEKTSSSSNIFSTLLRRNNKKSEAKNVTQSKSMSNLATSPITTSIINNNNKITPKSTDKKPGQHSNFFTSFLEKKRNKKQINADLKKGQPQSDQEQNTYQSFGNWPSDPPSLSVIDYSGPSSNPKPYYGESNIDTEDTSAHGSDIWKKSYGSDMTKVKRRWTMREPTKQSAIREEEDLTSRTLGRNHGYTSSTAINTSSSIDRRKNRNHSADREGSYDPIIKRYNHEESNRFLKVPGGTAHTTGKYNSVDTRYTPEKISYSPQKYDEYEGYGNNTLTKRGRTEKLFKGYSGGGGFVGTPSSGSESNNNRSVYLHAPAMISEMPRTLANGGGGGASLSGLSGRRTLSKDEISNFSGSRKETKQLSRSMSMAHPWGPRFIHNEIDYSPNNNTHLPPRPPSRSPSGSLGINSVRQAPPRSNIQSSRSPSKSFNSGVQPKPPLPSGRGGGGRKPVSSSSVESLLRQETPDEVLKKKGNSKLGRSKSMSVSASAREPRDGKSNRFSTLWFNKKNSNK